MPPYIPLWVCHYHLHQEVISWITRELISMILRAICIWVASKNGFYRRKVKNVHLINLITKGETRQKKTKNMDTSLV